MFKWNMHFYPQNDKNVPKLQFKLDQIRGDNIFWRANFCLLVPHAHLLSGIAPLNAKSCFTRMWRIWFCLAFLWRILLFCGYRSKKIWRKKNLKEKQEDSIVLLPFKKSTKAHRAFWKLLPNVGLKCLQGKQVICIYLFSIYWSKQAHT